MHHHGDRPRQIVQLERSPLVQWFKRASALVRWAILILVVGLGAAAIVGACVAALITLFENNA